MKRQACKKENKPKSKVRKVLDIVGYIIFGLVFVLVVVVFAQNVSGGQPNFFGYCYYYIQTGSMDGDKKDSFPAKTVIISKLIDEEDCYKLTTGDIITFTPTDPNLPTYITTKTHRIVSIDYENETIVTRGDANEANDSPIPFINVHSKFVKKSPLMTFFYKLISSYLGFLVLIFIPLLVLIIMQIYSTILAARKSKVSNEINQMEENNLNLEKRKKELEEQAIQEYLDSLKKIDKKDDKVD